MPLRVISRIVRFRSDFLLSGVGSPLPPGEYQIDDDEEIIEGLSWLAYRRVSTFIRVPSLSYPDQRKVQYVPVDPAELRAAEEADQTDVSAGRQQRP
jgi:hypothetical protein